MALFGNKTGFKNLRDLLLFAIGAGGVGFVLIHNKHGDINLSALTAFMGLLVSPYVIRTDEHRKPESEPEPPPRKRTPAKNAAKRAPAKKAAAKRARKR